MMVFEHSTTPVARQLKMLVYGGAGTGKTWFALHAPDPLIIDTESSTDAYRGQPTLPPFTVAKAAQYLADNGLGDAEANAALNTADWRKATVSPEGFKAAIEAYVEQHITGHMTEIGVSSGKQ